MATVLQLGPQGEVLDERVMELMSATGDKQTTLHKYGNTQLDISGDAATALDAMRSLIADEDCAGQGKNVEGNHITVRYGLNSDDHESVASYFRKQAPFELSLGATSTFPPSDSSDGAAVIMAPVRSEDLHRINAELEKHGAFIKPTFDYTPHATVAYVKLDSAFKYVGLPLTHTRFTANGATISKRDGTQVFVRFEGFPQDTWKSLGEGFGNVSGQAFPEVTSLEFGPQSELLFRFNDEHDPKTGQFGSGGNSSAKESEWKSSGTKVDGDVKTTSYEGKNQTIVVVHDTKENKITVKHLDSHGDLLVQQTHDSVGAARKELQANGIDHKFYATRSFDVDQPRDADGSFSMGTVAKFEHEDGRVALVTKYNGKFHVNVLKNGVPHLPAAIYTDKEEAVGKAEELLKRAELICYEYRDGTCEWC